MYSLLLLALAAADLAVAAVACVAWRRSGSTLLFFTFAALAAVTLAVLLAGVGHWLGPGDPLRDLHALPLVIATFAVPLTLFTLATLARRLDFPWARIDWGHGAVCLLATALLVASLPGLLALKALYPACWQDVVWYQRSVPPALACPGLTAAGEGSLPVVLPIVLALWLLFGAELWHRERWAWLLAAMAGGCVLLALPGAWGPLPGLLGASLCFAAIAATGARYAGRIAPAPGVPADD